MTIEIWKAVPGYEGQYEVSSEGRVRSLTRKIKQLSRWGKPIPRTIHGRMLRPGLSSSGYYTVALGRNNSRCLHDLVAEAFIGPRPAGQLVRHRDGNRANNTADNLEYGTYTENIQDSMRHGTWWVGGRREHFGEVAA